jgi:hypothetical protein
MDGESRLSTGVEPLCVKCGRSLWESHAHWADPEEARTLGWELRREPEQDPMYAAPTVPNRSLRRRIWGRSLFAVVMAALAVAAVILALVVGR